jgi:type II secretory pathway pseudopilin PulG
MMRRQQGFSYVVVMFVVAVLSIMSVRALEVSLMTERRDKERQLLWVGKAYADAIKRYYLGSPGTSQVLPANVKDLLLDQRANSIRRPLRQLYRDPITGSTEWGYLYKDDKLIGVYSLSTLRPLKRDGFLPEQAGFKDAPTYQNWRFVYDPVK